jgi:uncharacterized protein (DUF1697 family)
MASYAAFLRGVSPIAATMPALKACFVAAGFTDVKTVLSSGNVIFSARATAAKALERRIEAAINDHFGRIFITIVRSEKSLREIVATDPYSTFHLSSDAVRLVTFVRKVPTSQLRLPIQLKGARILCMRGAAVFSAYRPSQRGAAFLRVIERTYGMEVTTRTWDTVTRVTAAFTMRSPGIVERRRRTGGPVS